MGEFVLDIDVVLEDFLLKYRKKNDKIIQGKWTVFWTVALMELPP